MLIKLAQNDTLGKHYFQEFCQRAFAAFLAIALRFLADSFAALAFPPFSPPMRPRATAAGFFSGFSSDSLMLERLGMAGVSQKTIRLSIFILLSPLDR
jgi:hypothetical protein